ncbi:hypothetical protein C8R43DRAFT_1238032 [Mycena crocata]|nr:hypothetical protein C8R43DRAFT_1238032 [Mycena crocata]
MAHLNPAPPFANAFFNPVPPVAFHNPPPPVGPGFLAAYVKRWPVAQWHPTGFASARVLNIVGKIRNALIEPRSLQGRASQGTVLRRAYFFIHLRRYLTKRDREDPVLQLTLDQRTLDFFRNRFPQICLHDGLDDHPDAVGRSHLLAVHERSIHPGIIFLNAQMVEALTMAHSQRTIMSLTILVATTLYHELAHCLWTAVNGAHTHTPPQLNWNHENVRAGESGYVVEGRLMGHEAWPFKSVDQPFSEVKELVWSEQHCTTVGVILTPNRIEGIYAHFLQTGFLKETKHLFGPDDVREVVLMRQPTEEELDAAEELESVNSSRNRFRRYRYQHPAWRAYYRFRVLPDIFAGRPRNMITA